MRLARAALWAYDLPLTRALAARDGGMRRRGFVLCLSDDAGREAWGEAAPLPGHGSEDHAAALAGLKRFATWQGATAPENPNTLAAWLNPLSLGPAARCAVEAALLGLTAARRGLPLHQLLAPDAPALVPIAGLIDRREDGTTAGARLARLGHRAIKVKVGDGSLEADMSRLQAIAAAAPGIALRLDANRAWSRMGAAKAMALFAGAKLPIAYVEEPLESGGLLEGAALPQALDETLVGLSLAEALACCDPVPAAIVLKPMLLGCITAWRLAEAARARGIAAVIGSSFETGLGLRLAAALAAGTDEVAGLGTAPWFATDLVSQPDPALLDLSQPPVPDSALLEPLDVTA